MEMTSQPTPGPAAACHGGTQGSRRLLQHWRVAMIAGAVVVAGIAIALGQQWLTIAALAPLLYALPCAVMMFVCMRHMNHGQQAQATPADADRGERAIRDARS